MAQPEWKSPRRVEAEIRAYRHQRFEDYMVMEDRGELTRALALTALREEMGYAELEGADGTQTANYDNQVA